MFQLLLPSPRLNAALRTLSSQVFLRPDFLPTIVASIRGYTPLLVDLDGQTRDPLLRVRTVDADPLAIRFFSADDGPAASEGSEDASIPDISPDRRLRHGVPAGEEGESGAAGMANGEVQRR